MHYLPVKAQTDNFLLIRAHNEGSFTVYLVQLLQGELSRMEIRYCRNPHQLDRIRQTHSYGQDGIYSQLKEASPEELTEYLQILKQHQQYI
ncbi:MAG: hypothetical protein ACLFT3_07370 [Cyclobacteriaceae bacterium]